MCEVWDGRDEDEEILLRHELIEERFPKERAFEPRQNGDVDGWTELRVERTRKLEHHQPQHEWDEIDKVAWDVERSQEAWNIMQHKAQHMSLDF